MRYIPLLFSLAAFFIGNAQHTDSLTAAQKDSIKMEKLFSTATYPLIKSNKWTGVLPVSNVTEKPDPSIQYKLLMEEIVPIKDSDAAKEINEGLAEVGRIINLHVASGIPKNKLSVVVVVHGPALYALYTNEEYRKKWGIDNPNISLIRELMKNGVKFIACGKAMNFYDVRKDDMVSNINISLTAQTVLSSYQLKGYVWFPSTPK